jgi:trimethylamine--corrinoid protein Co-methyltransferase
MAAGNDLIVNCGMFATGLTCSHEQLLIDEEISAISRRIAAGIEVNKETMAADLIKQIGPRGETYLTLEHTLKRLRSGEYVRPRLAVRGPRVSWENQGAKDTYQLARDLVKQYARRPAPPLPEGIRARLAEIIAGFENTSATASSD